MRLITWNVRGVVQTPKVQAQLAAVASRNPDIIALQDVHPRSAERYLNTLREYGLPYGLTSVAADDVRPDDAVGVFRGVLIASRWKVQAKRVDSCLFDLLDRQRERALSAVVSSPAIDFELHTLYVPNPLGASRPESIARRDAQIAAFASLQRYLAQSTATPKVVCGDFNVTDINRLGDLRHLGLRDAHTWRRPWRGADVSWHGPSNRYAYRLDYVLASDELHPKASRYLHRYGRNTLSDHSPQEVDFGINGGSNSLATIVLRRLTRLIRR